jgi:Tol biopolymer transport system component
MLYVSIKCSRGFGGWPSGFPDGRWIALESDRDGNNEIYKIAVP